MTKQALNPEVLKMLQGALQYGGKATQGGAHSIADVGAKLIGLSPKESLTDLYMGPFQRIREHAAQEVQPGFMGNKTNKAKPLGLLGSLKASPEDAGAALANAAPAAAGTAALAGHMMNKNSVYLEGIKAACLRRGIDPAPFLKTAQQGPVPPVAPTTPPPAVDPRAGIKARQARERGSFQDSANPHIMERSAPENAVSDWSPEAHYNPGYIHNRNPLQNIHNIYSAGFQGISNKALGAVGLRTPEEQEQERNLLLKQQQTAAQAAEREYAKKMEGPADEDRSDADYGQQLFHNDPTRQATGALINQRMGEKMTPSQQQAWVAAGMKVNPNGRSLVNPYATSWGQSGMTPGMSNLGLPLQASSIPSVANAYMAPTAALPSALPTTPKV